MEPTRPLPYALPRLWRAAHLARSLPEDAMGLLSWSNKAPFTVAAFLWCPAAAAAAEAPLF